MGSRFAVAAAFLCGCAAPYLTAQRGTVTPQGSVRAQVSMGGGASSSALRVVRDARDFEKSINAVDCSAPGGKCFRSADFRPLVDGGLQLALFGPASFDTGLSVRYGFANRLDAGASLLGSGYRLDAGWQFAGDTDPAAQGWATALYLGWNHHRVPFGSFLEKVKLDGFGRDDLDTMLVASHGSEYVKGYFGARYMLSRWTVDLAPGLPILDEQVRTYTTLPGTDDHGLIHQVGGTAGLTAGYKRLFVGVELNVVVYRARALILDEHRLFNGVTFYPAAYVYGTY